MEKEIKERQYHIDLLRIVACFSVVLLHSASQYWYVLPITGREWVVCNSYDAISRFGVPVFVMISGMLFLSRKGEVDPGRIWKHNILRLITAYCAWSVIYGLWDIRGRFGSESVSWKEYVSEMIYGRYHLWFVPMIIGLYLLLPVLKAYTDHSSRKQLEYFLILFVVLQVGYNTILIINPAEVVKVLLDLFQVQLICSYAGYFLLGYYLYRYPLPVKWEKMLYAAGILSAFLAALVSWLVSLRNGGPSAAAFDSYSVFTFLVSVAVMVFFLQRVSGWIWVRKKGELLRELSDNTFGVYLMHLFVLEFLESKGIDSMSMNNIVGVPLMAAVCFILCNLVVAVLRRIPVAGKYLC